MLRKLAAARPSIYFEHLSTEDTRGCCTSTHLPATKILQNFSPARNEQTVLAFPTPHKHNSGPCQDQCLEEIHSSPEKHKWSLHAVLGSPRTLVIKHSCLALSPGHATCQRTRSGTRNHLWRIMGNSGSRVRLLGFKSWPHNSPTVWPWAVPLTPLEPFGGVTDLTNPCGLLHSKHSPVSDCFCGLKYCFKFCFHQSHRA